MKESPKDIDTYMTHDSASRPTSFSVDPELTPISEITNDKTQNTHTIKTYHDAFLDSK